MTERTGITVDPVEEQEDYEHDHQYLNEEYDPYPQFLADGIGGGGYSGDVCPRCGTPLKHNENLVRFDGETGIVMDLATEDGSVPLYHPQCYQERKAEAEGKELTKLEDFME